MEEEESLERLELFTPGGKGRWKVMHTGALNAATTFIAEFAVLSDCIGLENPLIRGYRTACGTQHRWVLPGNYPDFIVVMVFYLFCRRTKRILVTIHPK